MTDGHGSRGDAALNDAPEERDGADQRALAPERTTTGEPPDPKTTVAGLVVAVLVVTAMVTAASYLAPTDYAATAVGMVFLGATYWLVLRHSARYIEQHGLALGGLFEPSPLRLGRIARDTASALAIALLAFVVIAVPFAVGFRTFYQWNHLIRGPFDVHAVADVPKEALGQLLVIALPEEAFFRGYLQTELDALFTAKRRFLGADVSLAIPVASLVFAVGHVLTRPDPGRLAVFFPALLFGFLRTRTRGVGAPILFHALCNLLSSVLAAGYKLRG